MGFAYTRDVKLERLCDAASTEVEQPAARVRSTSWRAEWKMRALGEFR